MTATDLVLTLTEKLRERGVVDKFVEFFGPGLSELTSGGPRDHREHGARVRRDRRLLPVDKRTIEYLRNTNRDPAKVQLIEAYLREHHMFIDHSAVASEKPTPTCSSSTCPPSCPRWPAQRRMIASP